MLVIKSTQAEQATMTSREIADLTGSTHDNVLKTVRHLIEKGVVSGNATPYVHPQNGQTYSEFRLNYRDTMVVVSGYSVEMRAKIIDRWQALEAGATPVNALNDPAALRQMLLGYTEKVIALESTIKEQAPKVEYANALIHATGTTTIGDVAKSIGAPVMKMHRALKKKGVILKNNAPAAQYVTKGYFEEATTSYETKTKGVQIGHTARVTGRGIEFLRRFFERHADLFESAPKKKKERTLF